MELTAGGRYFLAQRKAQGKDRLTDGQADALAALLAPIRVAGSPARDACPAPVSGMKARGDFSKDDAA